MEAAAPDVDPVRGLASALATTVGRHGWTAVAVLLGILLFAPTVPLSLMLAWFLLWLTMNLMMMVTTRRLHLRLGGPFRMDPVHYRLMLMAQDRDFNENDYDALLALDDNTPTQRLRGASKARAERGRVQPAPAARGECAPPPPPRRPTSTPCGCRASSAAQSWTTGTAPFAWKPSASGTPSGRCPACTSFTAIAWMCG